MKNETINIREFMIIALGTNEKLHAEIDKVYETNPHLYYRTYRESDFVDDEFFQLFPTVDFLHIKRVTGIVQVAYQEENLQPIHNLIKKGYNAIYRYVTKHKVADYSYIMKLILRGRTLEEIKEQEIMNGIVIATYLLNLSKKPVINQTEVLEWLTINYKHMLNMVIGLHNPYTEQIKQKRTDVDRWMKELRVKDAHFNVGNILDNIIDNEANQILRDKGMDPLKVPGELFRMVRSTTFSMGKQSPVIGFLSGLLKIIGIPEALYSKTLSKQEYEKYFAQFTYLCETNNIPQADRFNLMIAGLIFAGVSKEYEETRNNSLKEVEEQNYYEIEKNNEKHQQIIQEVKQKESRLNIQFVVQKESNQKLEEQNEQLEREVARLKQELEKRAENDKELIALRNFVFEQKEATTPEETVESDEKERLSAYDIVIIGGSAPWTKAMKNHFPNFSYIGANAVNSDLSLLNRKGVHVFFNTATNSHTQYERVMKVMRQNENPFYYLNENANIDRTTANMLALLDRI